ncbi:hypothetical protein J1N35_014488 [Gossypium stocksii]|uniref:Uncharacterized protein n=1 Tax=Gossypium stocksii TaxID=47602 RepID=A0A9D4A9Y8_9ROSI|nr:hypothetical protein J1N35_014488 [Gossypium stocksii]
MGKNEQFMKPTKSVFGDSLYTQYVELQRKQIINWNQRRKEKMDVPISLKQKDKRTIRRGTSRSMKEKLDGMIWWMQETSPEPNTKETNNSSLTRSKEEPPTISS